jgi:nucleotide-binding universal stress UspA family protein
VSVILPIVTIPNQYVDAAIYDRLTLEARESGRRLLEQLSARATKKSGTKTGIVLREGEPADQIVRACRDTKSDLIVVGTHGRHGLPKFFLGSVAERVISRATCPVLTVRGK